MQGDGKMQFLCSSACSTCVHRTWGPTTSWLLFMGGTACFRKQRTCMNVWKKVDTKLENSIKVPRGWLQMFTRTSLCWVPVLAVKSGKISRMSFKRFLLVDLSSIAGGMHGSFHALSKPDRLVFFLMNIAAQGVVCLLGIFHLKEASGFFIFVNNICRQPANNRSEHQVDFPFWVCWGCMESLFTASMTWSVACGNKNCVVFWVCIWFFWYLLKGVIKMCYCVGPFLMHQSVCVIFLYLLGRCQFILISNLCLRGVPGDTFLLG